MADKARYYLEQSVPELKEFERQKIFTKGEISAISKKRSEFEHKVNSPGCRPIDYVRYAEYEMNLAALRRKRAQRLRIKPRSHFGQRTIFFIFERATRKFCGDVGLWMQYIEFAQKEGASRVLLKVFASVLKLHPTRAELWIYAARHAVDEHGDMIEARSFMQRGLRFNKGSKKLWLEYTKLELVYIAKIITRRQLLGLDPGKASAGKEVPGSEDMVKGSGIIAEEGSLELKDTGDTVDSPLNMESNPALNGAIPLTVFDAATKEIPKDINFVFSFYNLFSSFTNLPCLPKMLGHVTNHSLSNYSTSPLALFMAIKEPIIGVESNSPDFPSKIGTMLSKIATSLDKAFPRLELYRLVTSALLETLEIEDLDPAVATVIRGSLAKYFRQAEASGDIDPGIYYSWAKLLKSNGKPNAAQNVLTRSHEAFPGAAISI